LRTVTPRWIISDEGRTYADAGEWLAQIGWHKRRRKSATRRRVLIGTALSNSSTAPHVLSQHRRDIRVWASSENLLFIHKFSVLVGLLAELFKGSRPPMILCATFGATLAQPNKVCPLSNGVSVRFWHLSLPALRCSHHWSASSYSTDVSWIVVN
jgi:hypothetical protein